MNFGGAIRIFRIKGIDVFLHWTWILVAAWQIQRGRDAANSLGWAALQYFTLFAIVLMHELGHALACRSVGGVADKVVLWPLGGLTLAKPPLRPGAYLWTTAAGPLVNLVLVPFTVGLYLLPRITGLQLSPGAAHFVVALLIMNSLLLGFNLLPIFPLDGGQLLRGILWYFLGPVRSLQAAAIIGIVGIGGGVLAMSIFGLADGWLFLIAAFAGLQCLAALAQAKTLGQDVEQQEEKQELIRRPQMRCPACGQAAPVGTYWKCTCGQPFDTFATGGVCPRCGTQHSVTVCPDCRQLSPLAAWYGQTANIPVVVAPPPAFNSVESPPRTPDAPL